MKVIFLDIDGVLNCKETPNPRKFPYVVDKRLLARFRRLIERTGAKVVLSSTWRYDPAGVFSAKHWGIPFMDLTPDLPKRPRRDEILAWLKKHPRVTRFVVIDDAVSPLSLGPYGIRSSRSTKDYLLSPECARMKTNELLGEQTHCVSSIRR